jgi:hypothetical protein
MMGEAVGYAAFVSKLKGCNPREVYTNHLEEFMGIISSPTNIFEFPTLPRN